MNEILCLFVSLFVLGSGAPRALAFNSSLFTKVLIDNAEQRNALCTDGTPGFFYYSPSPRATATEFLVYFEGGGLCTSAPTCASRVANAPHLTSSLDEHAEPELSFNTRKMAHRNAATNPQFHDWHFLLVPYCTSDAHTGQCTGGTPLADGLYHCGHGLVVAIVDEWLARFGGDAATDVLVAGSSAGGVGATVHLDYIRERLPSTALVLGTSDGSLTIDFNHSTYDSRSPTWMARKGLHAAFTDRWNGWVSPACAALPEYVAGEPFRCLADVRVWFRALRTPLFAYAALWENFALGQAGMNSGKPQTPENTAFRLAWAAATRDALAHTLQTNSSFGYLIVSCLLHTMSFFDGPSVDCRTWQSGLREFYFYHKGLRPLYDNFRIIDPCDTLYECNPACTGAVACDPIAEPPTFAPWLVGADAPSDGDAMAPSSNDDYDDDDNDHDDSNSNGHTPSSFQSAAKSGASDEATRTALLAAAIGGGALVCAAAAVCACVLVSRSRSHSRTRSPAQRARASDASTPRRSRSTSATLSRTSHGSRVNGAHYAGTSTLSSSWQSHTLRRSRTPL